MTTEVFTDAMATCIDVLGATASYRYKTGDVISLNAYLEYQSQPFPDQFDSQVPEKVKIIHIKAADIDRPVSGETITMGDNTYTVKRVDHEGYSMKLHVI